MGLKKALKTRVKITLNTLAGVRRPLEKKVVFDSFKGRQYSDNPRAISEKLHELYPEYKQVWALTKEKINEPGLLPDYVKAYPAQSWKFRKELASAAAYVRNEEMSLELRKRKGQLFIQTWHGDRGIKKILYDAWEGSKRPDPVMDGTLTDLFVAGSEYALRRAHSAFRYYGGILMCGCPRNDVLINPVGGDQVRERIGVRPDQRILLYAPTLRKNTKVVTAQVDAQQTMQHLSDKLGGDWVCLVRAHPKSLGINVKGSDNLIDVSGYPDIAQLMMIADALITDYSSCAGDFILRKKPLFLAQFDREQYNEEDRTFYIDIGEPGFLIAQTQDELNALIDARDEQDYADNCEQIMNWFKTHESGHAAEDVCRWIDEHVRGIK